MVLDGSHTRPGYYPITYHPGLLLDCSCSCFWLACVEQTWDLVNVMLWVPRSWGHLALVLSEVRGLLFEEQFLSGRCQQPCPTAWCDP